ncbi:MAG: uroporphyrinogen-III synthase, partial [Cytophagales bacterium]
MEDPKRITKVGSILVSQPKPSGDKSPYFGLAEKYNLKVDFRPFIQINPIDVKDFRRQKINILDFSAVIFTSRNAVDHFF